LLTSLIQNSLRGKETILGTYSRCKNTCKKSIGIKVYHEQDGYQLIMKENLSKVTSARVFIQSKRLTCQLDESRFNKNIQVREQFND